MLKFYQAENALEAQMLIDYLGDARIRATLLDRYQSGAAGELSALNFPTVWLYEARDRKRAEQLLDTFLQQRSAGSEGDAWVCEHCGAQIEPAFDLCWQCGAGRPDE